MRPELLALYSDVFLRLNRAPHARWGRAPHKPVFLLAVLREIDRHRISKNLIPVTPDLAASFRGWWSVLVPPDTWTEDMYLPFRHLRGDGWWSLVRDGSIVDAEAINRTSTLRQLAALIDGGQFADDIWPLLEDEESRISLRRFLLQHHFTLDHYDDEPLAMRPMKPVEHMTLLLEQALRQIGRPAHFREITEALNALTIPLGAFDEKKVKARLDRVREVFVYFDKGTYALAEWGVTDRRVYARSEGGCIGDHIEEFLANRDQPADVGEVLDYVLCRKPCRELSIMQRLSADERFYPFGEGKYGLKRWVA